MTDDPDLFDKILYMQQGQATEKAKSLSSRRNTQHGGASVTENFYRYRKRGYDGYTVRFIGDQHRSM